MLQKLVIKNYAIIDHLVIEPSPGLNTVTGETGAGKSIILGALSLILGERADTSVLINKEDKAVIEGFFNVAGNSIFRQKLREADLEDEDICIIRREISASGKSRAFVNDTPVTLQALNELTSLLVDLQQQFGHLELRDDTFQMNALDAIAGTLEEASTFREKYAACRKAQQALAALQAQQAKLQQEADYKQFLYDELAEAALQENEIEETEQRLKQLANAERILATLQAALNLLEEGEQPVVSELKRAVQQLESIAELMPATRPLAERTQSAWLELKDIAAELQNTRESVSLDPEELERSQERLDLGYRLLKKHAMRTTSDLLELQASLAGELEVSAGMDEEIRRLSAEAEKKYSAMMAAAKALSTKRRKAVPGMAKKVTELLALVGMPGAAFDITIADSEPSAMGLDHIQFMLDANRSAKFQPLWRAASGGEMSRIMLCIKSLVAQALQLPTLIFDEVDTGISGEAARQVARLLNDLAIYRQVICITHQPQVAARGDRHFFVYKEAGSDKRLTTNVRVLQPDERVLAIARMIGGEQPTEAAIGSARELVEG